MDLIMSIFVNVINEGLLWWIVGAIVSGILMVIMGTQWEKGSIVVSQRKPWMPNAFRTRGKKN